MGQNVQILVKKQGWIYSDYNLENFYTIVVFLRVFESFETWNIFCIKYF